MKLKSLTSAILILSLSTPAFAQTVTPEKSKSAQLLAMIPSPDGEDPTPRISPMRKNDLAPFSGILFSSKATASVLADIETSDEKIKIEVEKAKRDVTAKMQFQIDEINSKCTTDKNVLDAKVTSRDKRIKELEIIINNTPSSFGSKAVWATAGAGIGIAMTLLVTFAVNQTSK